MVPTDEFSDKDLDSSELILMAEMISRDTWGGMYGQSLQSQSRRQGSTNTAPKIVQ